ncbi:glycosyltransferase family 4 protein [Aequorivita flava]|uniref:Glycosyltransferase n=1 Tax=Aequorivita flava TaxID=3114371 RepID=A0AB35YQH8_9FLAO
MKFLVITSAPTFYKDSNYRAYAPYVKEMNMWFKSVEEVTIISPIKYHRPLLKASFNAKHINLVGVPNLAMNNFFDILSLVVCVPLVFFKLYKEMIRTDHIHLRCPGNIGLLGCIVQVFFPKKKKTAKYAGNWDPKAKQPWSYRLQKWILSNTFLTRNMKVLVYGEWPEQTKNIKPFFTASYSEEKIAEIPTKNYNNILQFVFVGTLADGKRPLYALQLVENLLKKGILCRLAIYGEGEQREDIENYIEEAQLGSVVTLHGNQPTDVVEAAYKKSHFLILPSKSEGWPKVVAEAMFWGVVPLVTPVSCVPWMLDNGNRGIILTLKVADDTETLLRLLKGKEILKKMAVHGAQWSHQYTLELFEAEIKKLI